VGEPACRAAQSGWVALCAALAPAGVWMAFGARPEAIVAPIAMGHSGQRRGLLAGCSSFVTRSRELMLLWGKVQHCAELSVWHAAQRMQVPAKASRSCHGE